MLNESSTSNDTLDSLSIHASIPKTKVLGPYTRFAIWVQGCPHFCTSCMSQDMRPFDGGLKMCIDRLSEKIIRTSDIEGITISGGEPFLHCDGLQSLINRVRKKREIGVIVYTGYTLKDLHSMNEGNHGGKISDLLKCIDILIDGPYIKELDDGGALRGSSNQIVHSLTNRYSPDVIDRYYNKTQRRVEIHFDERDLFLVGIPGPEMLKTWQNRKILRK